MVGGLSILLVVWLFTNVTMRQLVECADVVKVNNPRLPVGLIDYSAIGHAAYGRPGKYMCMVPVLLTQFFCGCGYLVFIKTMLSPWFGSDLAALMFTLVIQVALAMRPTQSFLVGVAKMGNFSWSPRSLSRCITGGGPARRSGPARSCSAPGGAATSASASRCSPTARTRRACRSTARRGPGRAPPTRPSSTPCWPCPLACWSSSPCSTTSATATARGPSSSTTSGAPR
ncbi:unnamed protein product [Heterosigma akashiwo]